MDNFIYSIPTKAYFGKGQVESLGAAIKEFGGSKVLLAYGGGSVKENGIYDAVIAQFAAHGLKYTELSGIKPNPRVESVIEGITAYRESGCDFVKTSSGFHPAGGASVEAVRLMKRYAGGIRVKAAGGIATYEDAMNMIQAGADRLGCSASVNVVAGPSVIDF